MESIPPSGGLVAGSLFAHAFMSPEKQNALETIAHFKFTKGDPTLMNGWLKGKMITQMFGELKKTTSGPKDEAIKKHRVATQQAIATFCKNHPKATPQQIQSEVKKQIANFTEKISIYFKKKNVNSTRATNPTRINRKKGLSPFKEGLKKKADAKDKPKAPSFLENLEVLSAGAQAEMDESKRDTEEFHANEKDLLSDACEVSMDFANLDGVEDFADEPKVIDVEEDDSTTDNSMDVDKIDAALKESEESTVQDAEDHTVADTTDTTDTDTKPEVEDAPDKDWLSSAGEVVMDVANVDFDDIGTDITEDLETIQVEVAEVDEADEDEGKDEEDKKPSASRPSSSDLDVIATLNEISQETQSKKYDVDEISIDQGSTEPVSDTGKSNPTSRPVSVQLPAEPQDEYLQIDDDDDTKPEKPAQEEEEDDDDDDDDDEEELPPIPNDEDEESTEEPKSEETATEQLRSSSAWSSQDDVSHHSEVDKWWMRLLSKQVIDDPIFIEGDDAQLVSVGNLRQFLVTSDLGSEEIEGIIELANSQEYEQGISSDDFAIACQLVALAQAGVKPVYENLGESVSLPRFVTSPVATGAQNSFV